MIEVTGINNGIVLDHIQAGNGLKIFNRLMTHIAGEVPVVLVMNVDSNILGKKDIIKIEDTFDVNLNMLGLIDKNVTVNYIVDGKLKDKKKVTVPEKIKGYIKCKNPRCISHFDNYVDPEFSLYDRDKLEYVCSFCDEITKYE